jgi:RNA polymerase sigma-70 factor (ECF subfamily)
MNKKKKYLLIENYLLENQQAHYRFAYSYVKNKEQAMDILQDSIIKALRSSDALDKVQYLKTWFYRILINTSLDLIQRDKKIVYVEDNVLDYHLPVQEDEIRDIDLYEAIDHLSGPDKTVIILRYFEDMKIDDIAKLLGENNNTVKSRLYATLKKLRALLEEAGQ